MGLDRFSNFISKMITNIGIEELSINNNVRKIIANHIIYDINFIIFTLNNPNRLGVEMTPETIEQLKYDFDIIKSYIERLDQIMNMNNSSKTREMNKMSKAVYKILIIFYFQIKFIWFRRFKTV